MSKSLVQTTFGAHAAAYVTSVVHAKGASLGRLVELVQPQKHWRALDIATAAGHTALAFAPHVDHVVASDITDEMLVEASKLAASKGLPNVEVVKADAELLPFDDASFELVTCRIAPHHFANVAAFVAEAKRVLKPGATFAIVDNISPDTASTPGFTAAELQTAGVAYNDFERLRDPSHVRCLGVAEWTSLMEAAGFSVTHSERLSKDMEFQPWSERLGSPPAVIAELRGILTSADGALHAFLKPREDAGQLWFTLDEAIIIAKKAV